MECLGHQAWCSELRQPVLGTTELLFLKAEPHARTLGTLLSLDERAKPELFGVNAMKETTKRGG